LQPLRTAAFVLGALGALDVLASAAPARADPAAAGASSVVPVFSIAKSENKNQVQYVVRLDASCAPVGPTPVSAYWRMLEIGPAQTAPLLHREEPAYGLASQTVTASGDAGSQVRIILRALPGRPVTITAGRTAGGECHAVATASIAGVLAHLFNVYVHLKWDGVDYILLQGWSMDGSHVVRETMTK